MRLNRYLAACGLGSRRGCEQLITSGRVLVNGKPASLALQIAPTDRVSVDGTEVSRQDSGVWMLHKPRGAISTVRDPQGRHTVVDVARAHGLSQRLFPIGRLDRDTTGLLLLSDDGALAFKLTHPSWGIEKEYEAQVARALTPAELDRLRTGIELEDGPSAPCAVTQENRTTGVLLRLVLHEGRKRQIRRMLQALAVPLLHLHRSRVGPLELGDLPPGELRALGPEERRALLAVLAQPEPSAKPPA